MSFLERYEPDLYQKYLRTRHLDHRISDVFGDLEAVARIEVAGKWSADLLATSIVAELIEELRRRIAACDEGPKR